MNLEERLGSGFFIDEVMPKPYGRLAYAVSAITGDYRDPSPSQHADIYREIYNGDPSRVTSLDYIPIRLGPASTQLENAITTLGELGTPEAKDTLSRVGERGVLPDLRSAAARALESLSGRIASGDDLGWALA